MTAVIRLQGGLGNQLFQWALGRTLAYKGQDVYYDARRYSGDPTRRYHLDELLPFVPLAQIQHLVRVFNNTVTEGSLRYNHEIENVMGNVELVGYWQSEAYFNRPEVSRDIRRQVFGGKHLSHNTQTVAQKILNVYPTGKTAFLHVRRSDLTAAGPKAFHGLLDLSYYSTAYEHVRKAVPGVHFFVFSDDTAWAKANFVDDDITVVDCNPMSGTVRADGEIQKGTIGREWEDLWLMSLCRHAVTANSSFSWWGAWLHDEQENRVVVAPKKWFATTLDKADPTDICPERWLRL